MARYQGRSFLRDGHRRNAGLLRTGVSGVPAIVIDALVNDPNPMVRKMIASPMLPLMTTRHPGVSSACRQRPQAITSPASGGQLGTPSASPVTVFGPSCPGWGCRSQSVLPPEAAMPSISHIRPDVVSLPVMLVDDWSFCAEHPPQCAAQNLRPNRQGWPRSTRCHGISAAHVL